MPKWAGRYAQQRCRATLDYYGRKCHLCGRSGADSADHIIPRAAGGGDGLDNLRPAHQTCNSARGDLPLAEWFRFHPILDDSADAEPSRVW